MSRPAPVLAPCLLLLFACGNGGDAVATGVNPAPPGAPHATLAEWRLFADPAAQLPAAGVEPYDVLSPLFSDYTYKRRFLWLPEGATIGYRADEPWELPVGAILVKSFSYLHDLRDETGGERLLETRLLVREPGGWEAHTYVWDEAATTARRTVAGDTLDATWTHLDGAVRSNAYIVPNTNECQECHGNKPELSALGVRTRQLDHREQIARFTDRGWFESAPATGGVEKLVDPLGGAPLTGRVRSYLDANCGHCHTEGGLASQSALLLSWPFTDPARDEANWGVCKTPTSAGGATCGLTFDIVPGDPSSSIYLCRLTSTDPKVRMPPLVSRMPDDEGVALLADWIAAMPPRDCATP